MEITPETSARFDAWLEKRGRSAGTRALYLANLRRCLVESERKAKSNPPRRDADIDDPGITAKVLGRGMAPKTRRTYLATLVAWATFAKDGDLMVQLKDLRLPPAVRARPKQSLERDLWRAVVAEIRDAAYLTDAMRAALLLLVIRGPRIGDVLRMRKDEIARAVAAGKGGKLSFETKGSRRVEFDAAPLMEPLEALLEARPPRGAEPEWKRIADLLTRSREPGKQRAAAARAMDRALKRVATRIDVTEVYPHRFRRTYAVQFLRKFQADPQALIKLQHHMGWASPATAMLYVDEVHREELDQMGAELVAEILGDEPARGGRDAKPDRRDHRDRPEPRGARRLRTD